MADYYADEDMARTLQGTIFDCFYLCYDIRSYFASMTHIYMTPSSRRYKLASTVSLLRFHYEKVFGHKQA